MKNAFFFGTVKKKVKQFLEFVKNKILINKQGKIFCLF